MESVWDYPRPPVVVPSSRPVRVELGEIVLASSAEALRVLETSHPPVLYIPPEGIRSEYLRPSRARGTLCEYKGRADYLDAVVGDRRVVAVGWTYPRPVSGYEALRDHVAFYPGRVDAAWVGEERVRAQEGDFYGGWITADVSGPFKGAPGTWGW